MAKTLWQREGFSFAKFVKLRRIKEIQRLPELQLAQFESRHVCEGRYPCLIESESANKLAD
jgi:hypothetical protein